MRPPIRKLPKTKSVPPEPQTEVGISEEFITLGQLLKFENLIGTGGEARHFLSENPVWINGEQDDRRGRKLRPGDSVRVPGIGLYTIREKTADDPANTLNESTDA